MVDKSSSVPRETDFISLTDITDFVIFLSLLALSATSGVMLELALQKFELFGSRL
ncbi:hypothetical protein [Bradyrhizobium sp. AS23.2]|uniref:hypothetical protein n=1 Tax=Bradyrhizobium sp. AS23.2 TaxID=1680155 RepID=UPI00142FF956|nr:hypothetical protein [Bradyrhizobium sp. AS23.2]